ncbi:MAG: hypothetical protein KBD64_00525 [Gammaproteobacteria bacterium]|nr:hypothetical protein [Gammaproteobacteria bacterium]
MSTPQPNLEGLGTSLTGGSDHGSEVSPSNVPTPSALPLSDGTAATGPIGTIDSAVAQALAQGGSTTGSEHAEPHKPLDDAATLAGAVPAKEGADSVTTDEDTTRRDVEAGKLKAERDKPGESTHKTEERPDESSEKPEVREKAKEAQSAAHEARRAADQAKKEAKAATRKATSSKRKKQETANNLESKLAEVTKAENRLLNTKARLSRAAQDAADATHRATKDTDQASALETEAKSREEDAIAAQKHANELKEEAKKTGSMKYKWKPYIIAGVVVGVGVLVAAGVAAVCIFAPGTLSVAGLAAANITKAAVAWTAGHLVSAFTTAAAFVVNHIMPALANFFFQIGAGLLRAIGISASSHFVASVVAGLATVAAVPAALVTTTFFAYRKGRNEDCEPPVVLLSSDADFESDTPKAPSL